MGTQNQWLLSMASDEVSPHQIQPGKDPITFARAYRIKEVNLEWAESAIVSVKEKGAITFFWNLHYTQEI
ncbi:hypothetical protein FOVSG1_014653 [Fusarium oxysporum f. sp. vasinfectum]